MSSNEPENIYGIPDQEYYMRRYINDLPDPLLEIPLELDTQGIIDESINQWLDAISLNLASAVLSACPTSMTPISCSTDDFNRADSNSLTGGGNWIELLNPGINDKGFVILSNQLASSRAPAGNVGAPAAMCADFDPTTTFQSSTLVYKTLEFFGTPSSGTSNLGGPTVRMKQTGATLTWGTHVSGYCLDYTVTHGTGASPSLSNPQLNIWRRSSVGVSNLATGFLASPLVDGDVVRFTAANFEVLGTTLVCLKGYVNGVLVVSRNNISSAQDKITEGRPGIGHMNLSPATNVRIIWDNWTGCTETPVP